MVQWFCHISWRLLMDKCHNWDIGRLVSVPELRNNSFHGIPKILSLWYLFDKVLLIKSLKSLEIWFYFFMACYQRGIFIYSIEVNILISWTEASLGYWFHIMQRFTSLNVHVGQWPTFHGPVILFCILKSIWWMNVVLEILIQCEANIVLKLYM